MHFLCITSLIKVTKINPYYLY